MDGPVSFDDSPRCPRKSSVLNSRSGTARSSLPNLGFTGAGDLACLSLPPRSSWLPSLLRMSSILGPPLRPPSPFDCVGNTGAFGSDWTGRGYSTAGRSFRRGICTASCRGISIMRGPVSRVREAGGDDCTRFASTCGQVRTGSGRETDRCHPASGSFRWLRRSLVPETLAGEDGEEDTPAGAGDPERGHRESLLRAIGAGEPIYDRRGSVRETGGVIRGCRAASFLEAWEVLPTPRPRW